VLLLTSPLLQEAEAQRLRRAFEQTGPVVHPGWRLDVAATDLLAGPASLVRDVLDDEPRPAVLCGVGSGVLLALRVAVEAGEQVRGLLLATGRRSPGPALVRSVHRGVADLLPLATLQRLGAGERHLLQVLDGVRPQDHRALAARVDQPALVAWGRRDLLDRRPSERLASALRRGRLVPMTGAGPGWVWESPDRLADLLPALG
jgi:pimeloyl-ACP methyl ester carboxylesterase